MSAAEARERSLASELATAQQGYLALRTQVQDGEAAASVRSTQSTIFTQVCNTTTCNMVVIHHTAAGLPGSARAAAGWRGRRHGASDSFYLLLLDCGFIKFIVSPRVASLVKQRLHQWAGRRERKAAHPVVGAWLTLNRTLTCVIVEVCATHNRSPGCTLQETLLKRV